MRKQFRFGVYFVFRFQKCCRRVGTLFDFDRSTRVSGNTCFKVWIQIIDMLCPNSVIKSFENHNTYTRQISWYTISMAPDTVIVNTHLVFPSGLQITCCLLCSTLHVLSHKFARRTSVIVSPPILVPQTGAHPANYSVLTPQTMLRFGAKHSRLVLARLYT